MTRCGCASAQATTCEAIMTCVATAIGSGLDYNEATGEIELRISTDAGNTAQIGSDGGFYAPVSPGPGSMQWLKTVATLPAQAIGGTGGGNRNAPSTAPYLIEYDVAQGVDIYATLVAALADGTAFESITNVDGSVTTYTDNPGGIAWEHLGAVSLPPLQYDAGTRVNPTGRFTGAPSGFLSPDGGWAGFYFTPYTPRPVSELLRMVRGRMVVDLRCQRQERTAEQAMADVVAAVDAVVEAGAQDWCIISPTGQLADGSRSPLAAMIAVITAAGITPGVNLFREEATPPWEPADLVAAGAEWVVLASPERDGLSEVRIGEFVAAGLQVEAATSGRQYWTQQMFALGARAITTSDPVYARGGRGDPGDLDYRQNFIPGLETRTSVVGGLTPHTDLNTGVFSAGFARTDLPGRWFPERYAWPPGTNLFNNNQLLGTVVPIPNTTDYTLRLRVDIDPSSTLEDTQNLGIFFAVPDDRDISNVWEEGDPSHLNGYIAALNVQASIGLFLFRVDNGSNVFLGLDSSANLVAGEWSDLTVTVQGAQVTVSATNSTGTATIVENDSTHRGAYAFTTWDDRDTPMLHGYDNPADLVMYEVLP